MMTEEQYASVELLRQSTPREVAEQDAEIGLSPTGQEMKQRTQQRQFGCLLLLLPLALLAIAILRIVPVSQSFKHSTGNLGKEMEMFQQQDGSAYAGVHEVQMHTTMHDFKASHPDFECATDPETCKGYKCLPALDPSAPTKNLVASKLGADGLPEFPCQKESGCKGGRTMSTSENFSQWFKATESVNKQMNKTLVMKRKQAIAPDYQQGGLTWRPLDGMRWQISEMFTFFPMDGEGWAAEDSSHENDGHNMYFTMHWKTLFPYDGRPGEYMLFRGSDDLWVYINGELAKDIGGMHEPVHDRIDLDSLNLRAGCLVEMDIFFAHRSASFSDFFFETNSAIHMAVCKEYPHTRLTSVQQSNLGEPFGKFRLSGQSFVPGAKTCQDEVKTAEITIKEGSTYQAPGGDWRAERDRLEGDLGKLVLKPDSESTFVLRMYDASDERINSSEPTYLTFLDLDTDKDGHVEYINITGYTRAWVDCNSRLKVSQEDSHAVISGTSYGDEKDAPYSLGTFTENDRKNSITFEFPPHAGDIEFTLGISGNSFERWYYFSLRPDLRCSGACSQQVLTGK